MSNPRGFIEIERQEPTYRPAENRIKDFEEVENFLYLAPEDILKQAERCMDCGIPFCHGSGCPLCNVIPEFNELVVQGHWQAALDILLSTNDFPEFTGRICPAPCETACTAGLNCSPVTIRQIELAIIEKGFEAGWIKPEQPIIRTGKKVAVVGSGPAGMAVANRLNKQGHTVTLFERDNYAGGLLRYGIPDFKLAKKIVQRRVDLMSAEGVKFETGVAIGTDMSLDLLQRKFDAVCLCGGSGAPRDLPIPGRELNGIHFAMDFLHQQNCRNSDEIIKGDEILATGKKVVVIGGGDTGSDCVGTSIRQGAASVMQIEIMPKPPEERPEATPWPQWPYQLRTSSSHKEGCERRWNIASKSFSGNDKVEQINAIEVEWSMNNGLPGKLSEVAGSEFVIEADLILLAMGFIGPADKAMYDAAGLAYDNRGNIATDANGMSAVDGIFAAGDIVSGPSLVVRGIDTGRKLAEAVNDYLAN
ncbi:MAG: glutamate synthase subunit beta [Victivallaceae bacterium]|nr:glutamate synthase subunit beta [Victivallaceae bacterium]